MKRGKLLFGAWSKERRKSINILSSTVILFSTISLFFSTGSALRSHNFSDLSLRALFIFASATAVSFSLFFVYISQSQEFRIYMECIVIPKTFGRRVIPFSEVSKIELNTHQDEFIPEIEISLKDGTSLKYPKSSIQNWEEFYRVMLKEVGSKVKVVE